LDDCTGFEWDDANADKNWERQAEAVFFNEPFVVQNDVRHDSGDFGSQYESQGTGFYGRHEKANS
jgi:hypothetical protein